MRGQDPFASASRTVKNFVDPEIRLQTSGDWQGGGAPLPCCPLGQWVPAELAFATLNTPWVGGRDCCQRQGIAKGAEPPWPGSARGRAPLYLHVHSSNLWRSCAYVRNGRGRPSPLWSIETVSERGRPAPKRPWESPNSCLGHEPESARMVPYQGKADPKRREKG